MRSSRSIYFSGAAGIALLFTACILFGVSPIMHSASTAYADATADDLQKQIDERNKNIQDLAVEIQKYQDLTDKTSAQAKTLQQTIQSLTANGKALDLEIQKTSSQIDVTNLDISKLSLNITDSEKKIQTYSNTLAESMRQIQQSEDTSIIENLLNTDSLSGFLAEIDLQLSLNDSLQSQVRELRGENVVLSQSKSQREASRQQLLQLQAELSGKKKAVDYTKQEQSKLLSDTKDKESTYQKLLADRQVKKAAFEKDVFDYEAKLKYSLDPNSLPPVGSSPLSWPVANVTITQLFGKTVGAEKLYVSGSHNGVDFGARIGTPVLAVRQGTVMGTGDTDITCPRASFGRWVLIRHDDGLASIYAHLSVISAKQGDAVTTGQVIGYSGNTGYTTGPHVHLTVYAANAVSVQQRASLACAGKVYTMPIAPINAYLDPMLYLPPYGK